MIAKELISDVVPALKTSDRGIDALHWMEVCRISHIPIVNNLQFLGLIADTDIFDLNSPEEPLGNHKLSLYTPYVSENQHVYEVIELVQRMKLTVVPVLDKNMDYLGVITLHDLLQAFAKITAVEKLGSIIILEMNVNDYSLSEISQIVEGNDAKILSLYISSAKDSTKLDVTLKINKTDLSAIMQTFLRYNYTIKASFMEEGDMDDIMRDRYEQLMRYLNV
ncbi:MAG: CBS domain-containing protein [Bacteroidota bacterium]